eukprot:2432096-Prymnesium_polylepis.2
MGFGGEPPSVLRWFYFQLCQNLLFARAGHASVDRSSSTTRVPTAPAEAPPQNLCTGARDPPSAG